MSRKLIFRVMGSMLLVEALAMVPALIIALIYRDGDAQAMAASIGLLVLVGAPMYLLCRKSGQQATLRAREGFLIVALSWLLLSVFGALPFVFSGLIPNFVSALFESVSGFTTTGATVITDFEKLPHGVTFWRSFTHWIGGMGILVLCMAVVPSLSARSIHIMRAEMPGPIVGKIVPRARDTAKILYLIYIAMTVVLIIMLCCGGMSLFDSLV